MASFTATVAIIFSLCILGTLGVPLQPNHRKGVIFPSGSYCGNVRFTQQTGSHETRLDERSAKSCQRILNNNVPTNIYLTSNGNNHCTYRVLGFSGSDCEDYTRNHVGTLDTRQLQTFNERSPTCSFRLADRPFGKVMVRFFHRGYGDRSFEMKENDNCINIPGSCGSYYPERVTADNGFQRRLILFPEHGCYGKHLELNHDGTIGSAGQTRSFRIEYYNR